MKALFCTDGSKISFNSIYNFAKWMPNITIDAICIIDWSFLPEDIDIEKSDFNISCSNLADNILKSTENELQKNGLTLGKTTKMCGSVANLILDELKNDYEIVLLGSHGKKGLQKWIGPVSSEVLNNSPKTVYISKHRNNSQKILLVISDKKNTHQNFKTLLENMNLTEAEIHIIMVNENPNLLFLEGTLDTNWYLKIEQEQKKYSYKIIKELEAIIENLGFKTYKSSIITGDPAEETLKYTTEKNIDLVILDDKKVENKAKLTANQTIKRISDHIVCDICVIR